MKVSVIILNYQSYQDTISYVCGLKCQQNIELSILVVDNCSPNGSFEKLYTEFADDQQVEVIKSECNGGYAYGNNFGLKHIETRDIEFVLISNNDVHLNDPNLINKMVKSYKKLNKVAFIAPIVVDENGKTSNYSGWNLPKINAELLYATRFTTALFNRNPNADINQKIRLGEPHIPVDCLPGSLFLGSKDVFFKLGLFDEHTFLYMEENILGKKAKDHGLTNYLITETSYTHFVSQTISKEVTSSKMRKYFTESKKYFFKQYLGANKLQIILVGALEMLWCFENALINVVKKIIARR